MTNDLDLVAIKKNDVYYVREKDRYPSAFPDSAYILFDVDRQESFNDRWGVFDTLPTSAERCIVGRNNLIGYKLKDGFQTTEKTPRTLPPPAFEEHEDYDDPDYVYRNSDIRGLYDPEFEKLPDVWEPIDMEIELIDEDCEPLTNAKYKYKSDFPYYIQHHLAVRHKYPCYIESANVFKYIVRAVKENLPEHCYITSDHDFHFAVDVRIPLLHDETHRVDRSAWNAKKPKWAEVPLRDIQKTIIDICTPHHDYENVINDVHADNYHDLEKKMDGIIKSCVDLMLVKPVVCLHCKGYGWTIGEDDTV